MQNSATSKKTARAKRGRAWSYSTGEWGTNRVRLFDRGEKGLYVEWWKPGATDADPLRRVRMALGHHDRERAKEKADELALQFRKADSAKSPKPVRSAVLTLAKLFDMYEREVTPGKTAVVQAHDRRAFKLFLEAFGTSRQPATLNLRDWDAFIRERRSGRLRPGSVGEKREVRARPIEQDLQLLRAVLNWACRAGDGMGAPLLERNPLAGLKLPREDSPRRTMLSAAQYQAVLTAAAAVGPRARLFVVLAHETGHRAASIRQLRWNDVDLEQRTVTWRGANDKIGLEHTTPLTGEAVAVLAKERARQGAIGDAWVFPALRGDRTKPMSGDAAFNLWKRIATGAGIPKGERYGWHSLRRKFASELRHVALKDLGDLGGWKSATTILTCYVQSSQEAQREALQSRRSAGQEAVARGN